MKLALILSGQARTLNTSTLEFLKKYNINYDIFIHYWLPENNSYNNCGNLFMNHSINNISDNLHENIIKIYNPKKIIYEKQIIFTHNNMIEYSTNKILNTISEFYGIQKGFELIENKNDYTHFMKIRFDLNFNEIDNINNIDNNSVYFWFIEPHICNFFWIAPLNNVEIFNIYSYIYTTNKQLTSIPELIIKEFIDDNNMLTNIINSNVNLDRNYIKKGILFFNQSNIDILNCCSLINYYTNKYNTIFLFMKDDLKEFIDYYCKNITNIHIIYISFEEFLKYFYSIVYDNIDLIIDNEEFKYLNSQYDINKIDKLYIAQTDIFNNNYNNVFKKYMNTNNNVYKAFYEPYGINYNSRYEYFNIIRDYNIEEQKYKDFVNIYGNKYNLYNCSIEYIKVENYVKLKYENNINLNNLTFKYFDIIKILLNAESIHLIPNDLTLFIYLLDMKYNIFKDKNIYFYNNDNDYYLVDPIPKHWKLNIYFNNSYLNIYSDAAHGTFYTTDLFKNNLLITYPTDIYIDDISNIKNNNNYKIFVLIEPIEIQGHNYEFINNNHNLFDLIITYDENILKFKNSKKCIYGTSWVDENNIIKQNNKISFIVGSKKMSSGHYLRHKLYYNYHKINKNLQIFISSLCSIENLYNCNYIGKNLNDKNILFNDFSYHICIENCRQNNYFSEKIMDCFQTMTVPIYWGCPNIGEYFDIKGIIIIDSNDIDIIIEKINSINFDTFYENNLESIKLNFELSKKYLDYNKNMINIIHEKYG